MKIITLTSDMGLDDHYVASLKGTILSNVENPVIIDISHTVQPFDFVEAGYLLSWCYKDFPKGTIHVIGVDSEPKVDFKGSDGIYPTIMVFEEHYFISNDNGFFDAFLKEQVPASLWRIDDVLSNPKLYKFPTKNMLLAVAIKLMNGAKIETLASPVEDYKKAYYANAILELDLIRGHIIRIDGFGNAVTNIHQSLFEKYGKDVPFIIYFKRATYYIDVISNAYNDVPEGEKVAIFNENGHLEIAMNRAATRTTGGAQNFFNLQVKDMIQIEFTPKGSRDTIDSLFR